jgi:hypothetical protein
MDATLFRCDVAWGDDVDADSVAIWRGEEESNRSAGSSVPRVVLKIGRTVPIQRPEPWTCSRRLL